jgi:hypothetical protein
VIHRLRFALAVGAVALAISGCQDLNVTNPNNPDRTRATQDPATVESFVASSFRTWWEWVHDDSPVWVFSTVADEFTAAFADFGILDASSEPRQAWNNSPVYARREANEDPWYGLYATLSVVNDALVGIDSGLTIMSGGTDVTPRADAVGKFMQGLVHGQLALYFDKAYIVSESLDLTTWDPSFSPYQEVMDTAIAELQDAITLAQANSFTLPSTDFLHQSMDNQELVRLAHSYIARYMASVARTRAERDAVLWGQVLMHAEAGITTDFAPLAVDPLIIDDFKRVAARERTGIPGDFARVDYMTVGPADSTGRFMNWLAQPVANRTVFQLITKDRRIHGATPSTEGLYLGYTTTNRFAASRGTYHQSRYYYHRFGRLEDWRTGGQEAFLVSENDLLRAEALIRLNRAAEAVPLINQSRVSSGQLPPVDINGPPDEPGCVPRKQNGSCGSLWDALRYEKRIEGLGVNGNTAFFDARGWQMLPVNSLIHLPVPGRELETLALPLYTLGGGGAGSAPAPDPERCPVSLPRCP